MIERQTLTLVNRDSPSQTQRILLERAIHLLTDFLRLFINHIFGVLPSQLRHTNRSVILLAMHLDEPFVCLIIPHHSRHSSNLTVIVFLARIWIILDKHHLCPLFQHQTFIGRIAALREVLMDFCHKSHFLRLQCLQLLFIVALRHSVMCRQTNPILILWRHEIRYMTGIEGVHHRGVHLIGAYLSQQVDELSILLSIDVFQFDGHIRNLLQSLTTKEVRSVVIR